MLPPEAAPKIIPTKLPATDGSSTTGTACDFVFLPPRRLITRRAASSPIAFGASSLFRKRLNENQPSVCLTPLSSAKSRTERLALVVLYCPTKPSEFASVTCPIEFDQLAPFEFVIRSSTERPAASASLTIAIFFSGESL